MKYVAHVKIYNDDTIYPSYALKFGDSLKDLIFQIKKIGELGGRKPINMVVYNLDTGKKVTNIDFTVKDWQYSIGYNTLEINKIY